MFKKILQLFTGDQNKRRIDYFVNIVENINALEP